MIRNLPTWLPTAAVFLSVALAQQPTPNGFSGSFAVCSQVAPNSDQIQFLGTAPNLTLPLTGRVARSLHRRALQAPQEPEIVSAYDGVSALPVVMVPTETVGAGGATSTGVQVIDFRTGAPVNANLPLGGSDLPYDILVHPAQPRAFVVTFGIGGSASIVLWQIGYGPGTAPGITGRVVTTLGANPFVTRMALSANGQQLVVAGTTAIATFSLAGAAPVLLRTVPIPGTNMMIGTNPVSGLATGTAVDTMVGTRSRNGATSHSFFGIASTGAPVARAGGVSPFGAGLTLAPGFHEIGVATVGGLSVCHFLVALPGALGVGAIGRVPPVGFTTMPLAATPFGNPELPRTGATDPLVLAGTTAAGADVAIAFGTGVVYPAGALAISAPLPGFIEPASMDRPYNLPGTSQFAFTMGVGGFPAAPPGVAVLTVAPPPLAFAATAVIASALGASSLPNPATGGLFPIGPVLAQGFAGGGAVPSDLLVVGPAPTPVTLTNVATAAVPAGGFVFVPTTASTVPTFGPRRPAFNAFPIAGGTQVDLAIPAASAGGTAVSIWQLAPLFGPVFFFTQTAMHTSELRAL